MSARIVVVTGSRDWECFDLAVKVLGDVVAKSGEAVVVHHGNCRGVDISFRDAAKFLGVKEVRHEPRWNDLSHPDARVMRGKHGDYDANAGPRRNSEMIALGPDFVIACHPALERSSGTYDCVRKALDAGIKVYHFLGEDGPPLLVRSLSRGKVEYE